MAKCYLGCPMLNKFGFCESAMRKAECVRACPHDRLALALQREKKQKAGGG